MTFVPVATQELVENIFSVNSGVTIHFVPMEVKFFSEIVVLQSDTISSGISQSWVILLDE